MGDWIMGQMCRNLRMLVSLGIMDHGVWAGRDFVSGGDNTVNIVGGGLILICN